MLTCLLFSSIQIWIPVTTDIQSSSCVICHTWAFSPCLPSISSNSRQPPFHWDHWDFSEQQINELDQMQLSGPASGLCCFLFPEDVTFRHCSSTIVLDTSSLVIHLSNFLKFWGHVENIFSSLSYWLIIQLRIGSLLSSLPFEDTILVHLFFCLNNWTEDECKSSHCPKKRAPISPENSWMLPWMLISDNQLVKTQIVHFEITLQAFHLMHEKWNVLYFFLNH